MQVTEWLNAAKAKLTAVGFEPIVAEILMQRYMEWTKTQMVLARHEAITTQMVDVLEQQLKRVIAGEPVQYITGKEYFYDRLFAVDTAVLIPRPETEELVEQVVLLLGNYPRGASVVDVGTGSGAIAVTLKKEQPELKVSASDISAAALIVAQRNAKELGADVAFVQGDLLQPFIERGEQFDIIVSNPPYIALSETDVMDESVIAHEPHLALFAEDEGLALYHRMIEQLPLCLKAGGLVAFEIGYHQGEAVKQSLASVYPDAKITVAQDLSGNERMVIMQT